MTLLISHRCCALQTCGVFGMIYAPAEDDFNSVETDYIKALGRTAAKYRIAK